MTLGCHREEIPGVRKKDGTPATYIVVDAIADGRFAGITVNPSRITRFLEEHAPVHGKCPCCMDPFVDEIQVVVEHTTWGEPMVATICGRCAVDPFWKDREVKRVLESRYV